MSTSFRDNSEGLTHRFVDKESQNVQKPSSTEALDDKLGDAHLHRLTGKKLITVLLGMSCALFFAFVDQTGITIALPYIAESINAEKTIILFGRFSDIFGRKSVLIASMIIMSISDLICGFSNSGVMLYVFRAFSGVGQAGITSLTMVIVSDIVTLEQRGKYQGILGSFVGLGNGLGPFICSGFIVGASWRDFYHMLCPLFIIAAVITCTAGLILFLIPINGGGSIYEWDSGLVIGMFISGGLCLIMFVIVEWKIAKLPLIPIRLFNNRSLNLIYLQSFCFGLNFFSTSYFFAYYFEIVRGYSTNVTSCFTLAVLLTQAICGIASGFIISMVKHFIHVVIIGYCFQTLGTGLLLLWEVDTPPVGCVFICIVIGIGNGCIFQPTLVAAQSHAKLSDRSVVISIRNVVRSFGGAVGLAFCSLIYSNTILNKVNADENLSSSTKIYIEDNLYSKIDISSIDPSEVSIVQQYFMDAIKNIFYLWFPLMILCLLTSFFLKDHGLTCIDEEERNKKKEDEIESISGSASGSITTAEDHNQQQEGQDKDQDQDKDHDQDHTESLEQKDNHSGEHSENASSPPTPPTLTPTPVPKTSSPPPITPLA
ncbi:hypothetical protein PACTADRAFT_15421 [Pachysolen tannophilus NRRL Y-2460]|uniref:Major facilitator superfamily (MFS) profile domain-containing protein n=1 Tax=Pachysolen tannophilus NRRL Y-2460 TaxID=669874 RepID=A0A1E4TYU6_PACTA|nr:hypothetical protein PACTADRAFT_15421 [Pachysolen tannophilus NRRL Y-2460]